MTDNIPPEPHDDIRAWRIECGSLIAKLSMASCFDKPRLALAMKIDEAVDRMRRPAPAPARISPEVRETILLTLRRRLKEKVMHLAKTRPDQMEWPSRSKRVADVTEAIAFVEALP
jgi:acyl-CoA reductase-like NAD-dependent aldehyde dehydrogenase